MKIALASPPYPQSIEDGIFQVKKMIRQAAAKKAAIICFPESYIPGYPGLEFRPEKGSPEELQWAITEVCRMAAESAIAVILPMDKYEDADLLNVSYVISKTGVVLGYQTKNQLDPSEDKIWTAGTDRQLFKIEGLTFGITICHEGFRYPETVRWATVRGAKLIFHPNCTGSNLQGENLVEWGHKSNPYYEKAQQVRSLENAVYFASSNYCFRYPDSASSVIGPDGTCMSYQPYRESGVIVVDIDPKKASGIYAKRLKVLSK